MHKSNKRLSIFKGNGYMYYIEDDITFQDGITTKTLNLHTIGQIRVDYINNEIEVQIASFANRRDWVNDNAGKITGFIFKYDILKGNITILGGPAELSKYGNAVNVYGSGSEYANEAYNEIIRYIIY